MTSSARLRAASRLGLANTASLVAVGLVLAEAAAHYTLPGFTAGALVLLVAIGLAFVPFLPAELWRPSLVVPLVPLLGIVIAPIILVAAATIGVPLTGTSIRLMALGFTLALLGLSARRRSGSARATQPSISRTAEVGTLLVLGGIVVLGLSLTQAVLGAPPVPGADWGHYLLYADQIRVEGALLIRNPFWMGGGLWFPQDTGAPTLYAAHLLAGGSAGVLVQGIWLFWVLGILSVFVFGACLWGGRAGLISAGLWAVLPAGLNTLSWHGLAQTYALAILPLVALCVGATMRGWWGWRWALLLAATSIAVAGAHRLTALVATVALLPVLVTAVLRSPRAGGRFLGLSVVFALLLGGGLLIHLVRLHERTGGPPDSGNFVSRRVDWSLWVRDLTWIVIILGFAGLAALALHRRSRRDRAWLVLVGLLVGPVALSYAWLADIPLDYMRMGYYAALPLVLAIGAALGLLVPRAALALALLPIVIVSMRASDLGPQYRDYYQMVNGTTLRGLSQLQQSSESPSQLVVADACWSFVAPWILRRPTLGALEKWAVSVKLELRPARTARRIIYGGEPGRRLAHRRGVRYVLLDPKCSAIAGRTRFPTLRGNPIFASNRLLILELLR